MADILLRVENLVKRFGGLVATDSFSMDVKLGEIHAIIGPNGAGKTTLIHQLSGLLKSDSGTIHFDGNEISQLSAPKRCDAGMVRSYQITSIFRDFSVLDNVAMSIQAREGHSFRFWRNADNDRSLSNKAMKVLNETNLQDKAGVLAFNEPSLRGLAL